MKIDKTFNPNERQIGAIFETLHLFPEGYELKKYINQEFTIEATLDLFTGAFMSMLLDRLGNTDSYNLKISRDEETRLRTVLTISFFNPL